jgi:signal transduction histidine kinase
MAPPATPNPRPLRVLHLEDSEVDHELVQAHLRAGGVPAEVHRIDSEAAFIAALDADWDVVLSDYNLPGFSGLVALDLLKARGSEVPFILVTGEMSEDMAVQSMRNGADDYVLKANLARLAPALLHAVEAAEARRARRRAEDERDANRQRLSELAQHLQTSIEHERQAIARELHDDVGGSLTALKFDLDWIQRHAESPGIVARARSAAETVSAAIEASQRIMHNLRPAILEQGLAAALQWICSRFERRTGVVCMLQMPRALPELPPGVALVAYRTAQEALTNVSKHAMATQVNMDLSLAGGVLSLEIADNGRGLSREDLAKARSFGIRGLHERAGTVGGWVDVTSGAAGTTLILSVPLTGDDANPEPAAAPDSDDPTGWGELTL